MGRARRQKSLPRGTEFGRYIILDLLGAGGMGAVYRAYDPALDRGLALKILSVRHRDLKIAAKAKARLLREAQALAKLSHPNVVAVHDAGFVGYDVFVAMTLVEGETLAEWMNETHTWQEVLEVMIAAGQGLAAAHKAGIIHRDFKPDNVLVGEERRVRVLDFGLARGVDETETQGSDASEAAYRQLQGNETYPASLLHIPLTRAGGIIGTPLYMSPEQHLRKTVDERSDQFSFSLVLYEALYGVRPYAAESVDGLMDAILSQEVLPGPHDSDVPAWLHDIVLCGLAPRTEDRHPTMDSLLDKLINNPEEKLQQQRLARRRRTVLFSFASLIVLLLASLLTVRLHHRAQIRADCEAEANTIVSVWNRQIGERIDQAFSQSDVFHARDTWRRAWPHVDAYVARWKEAREKVCREGMLDKSRNADLLTKSRVCLDEQKDRLRDLAVQWSTPTKTTINTAANSAQSFPLLRFCTNETELARRVPLPTDPSTVSARKAFREQLVQADAFASTGQFERALSTAEHVLSKAKEGDLIEIATEARLTVGTSKKAMGRYGEAKVVLETAFYDADTIGDDMRALAAAASLVAVVGCMLAQPAEGIAWYWLAEGKIGRLALARTHPHVAYPVNDLGNVYGTIGDYEKAEEMFQQALVILKEALGPTHPHVANPLVGLGKVYVKNIDYDRAEKMYQRALTIWRKSLGPDHPYVAHPLNDLGSIHYGKGENEQAEKMYQRALTIWERALGPNHALVVDPLMNLGIVYAAQGNYDRAENVILRALTITQQTMGPTHPSVADPLNHLGRMYKAKGDYAQAERMHKEALTIGEQAQGSSHSNAVYSLNSLGSVYRAKGDYAQAEKMHRKALAISERAQGPTHRLVASTINELGMVFQERGDYERAEKMYRRAISLWEKALGPDHPKLVPALSNLAGGWLAQRRFGSAREILHRVAEICEERTCEAEPYGDALFLLAKVLVALEGDTGRAVGLARQAREVYSKTPRVFRKELGEINAWLEERAAE